MYLQSLCPWLWVNMHTLCPVLCCKNTGTKPRSLFSCSNTVSQRQQLTELIACKYCKRFVKIHRLCFDLEPKCALQVETPNKAVSGPAPLTSLFGHRSSGWSIVVEKWSEATDVLKRDDSGPSVMARFFLTSLWKKLPLDGLGLKKNPV